MENEKENIVGGNTNTKKKKRKAEQALDDNEGFGYFQGNNNNKITLENRRGSSIISDSDYWKSSSNILSQSISKDAISSKDAIAIEKVLEKNQRDAEANKEEANNSDEETLFHAT